jgi:hypothetical protein
VITRITTPLDSFLQDLARWLDLPWFIWACGAGVVAAAVVAVVVAKLRTRAHDRVPHYKRST